MTDPVTSLGGGFNAFPQYFERHGCATVYKNDHRGMPVAEINLEDGSVSGVIGNTGNRFERLSDVEKMDIGQLAVQVINYCKSA